MSETKLTVEECQAVRDFCEVYAYFPRDQAGQLLARLISEAKQAAAERARAEEREACARLAEHYERQNHKASVDARRRANKLGDDPFGHGEMASVAADVLADCEAEAAAIAAAIRARGDST